MKKIPRSSMPPAGRLKPYLQAGESFYASRNRVADLEYLSVPSDEEKLLHCFGWVRQEMLPFCHQLRQKQRFLALTWIEEGGEFVRSDRACFWAEAGEIVLMAPGCDIEFAAASEGTCRKTGVMIEGAMLLELLAGARLEGVVVLPDASDGAIRKTLWRLRDVLSDPNRNAGVCLELIQQLADLVRLHKEPAALNRLRRHVNLHWNEDLRSEELASVCGVSVSQLGKLTRLHWGKSPHRYVRDFRMAMACKLLQSGDFSIKEIADRVGYRNEFNFSTEFRKVHGVSPREFRGSR